MDNQAFDQPHTCMELEKILYKIADTVGRQVIDSVGHECSEADSNGNYIAKLKIVEDQYMKKLYRVQLNEIHVSSWDVEATSEQNAVNEVLDGCGDLIRTEYCYTPDNDAVHHVSCMED